MRVAVLPFSAAEGVPPALGRQFATFVSDTLRNATGQDVNIINFMVPVTDQPDRSTFLNLGDAMMEKEQMAPLFEQIQPDLVVDGVIRQEGDKFHVTQRFTKRDSPDQAKIEEREFDRSGVFQALHGMLKRVGEEAGLQLPAELAGDTLEFGTDNAESFLRFLEGMDALSLIQRTNGMVPQEFDPEVPLNTLLESVQLDDGFEGPFVAILEIARASAQYRIGKFAMLEDALKKLAEIEPNDYRPWYVLAEIHMGIGEAGEAADFYEKAIQVEPNDPALYTRLGIAQMSQGMPVNAERTFRKALEREGPDKPSTDYLASVLTQTGRVHEIPALWKERIEANPQDPGAHAKYGYSLMQAGQEEEGEKAFDHALEILEDKYAVKRYYAPLLAQKEQLDRAMDFYEDCLDVTPTDIPLMWEYAQTLDKAGREFEIPPVLRNILAANPDPNMKAQATGWLIELEQPKRVEIVQQASAKAEAGDFESALKDLKPLRNWLSDYWKLWAVLAGAHNAAGQFVEAEEAAGRLVNIMPGYEPAYGELMHALSGQAKHDQAYNAMKWAAMNMPQSLPIHLNFGLAAKHAGHVDEARALAKQIREAVGANEQVEAVLREMES
ncbi:MAG: hypothetical protein QOJ65_1402 [Fimbriimonadaceae bacterium]|jgi:Flp pilus assembly protein TadD|nr:hypothetical protein [Fimbriimonadaceae bacterium]